MIRMYISLFLSLLLASQMVWANRRAPSGLAKDTTVLFAASSSASTFLDNCSYPMALPSPEVFAAASFIYEHGEGINWGAYRYQGDKIEETLNEILKLLNKNDLSSSKQNATLLDVIKQFDEHIKYTEGKIERAKLVAEGYQIAAALALAEKNEELLQLNQARIDAMLPAGYVGVKPRSVMNGSALTGPAPRPYWPLSMVNAWSTCNKTDPELKVLSNGELEEAKTGAEENVVGQTDDEPPKNIYQDENGKCYVQNNPEDINSDINSYANMSEEITEVPCPGDAACPDGDGTYEFNQYSNGIIASCGFGLVDGVKFGVMNLADAVKGIFSAVGYIIETDIDILVSTGVFGKVYEDIADDRILQKGAAQRELLISLGNIIPLVQEASAKKWCWYKKLPSHKQAEVNCRVISQVAFDVVAAILGAKGLDKAAKLTKINQAIDDTPSLKNLKEDDLDTTPDDWPDQEARPAPMVASAGAVIGPTKFIYFKLKNKIVAMTEDGVEAGYLQFKVRGTNTIYVNKVEVFEAFRKNDINTNMLKAVVDDNPSVTTISGILLGTNKSIYHSTLSNALGEPDPKDMLEAQLIAIRSTPAYKSRAHLGFTHIDPEDALDWPRMFQSSKPTFRPPVGNANAASHSASAVRNQKSTVVKRQREMDEFKAAADPIVGEATLVSEAAMQRVGQKISEQIENIMQTGSNFHMSAIRPNDYFTHVGFNGANRVSASTYFGNAGQNMGPYQLRTMFIVCKNECFDQYKSQFGPGDHGMGRQTDVDIPFDTPGLEVITVDPAQAIRAVRAEGLMDEVPRFSFE